MTTATAARPMVPVTRKPRTRQPRSIRMISPGRAIITVGKYEAEYTVTEFIVPAREDESPGRGFRCEKFGGEVYDIFLAQNGQDDTCDCRGFEAHGHCKHRGGLKALLQRGLLDSIPTLDA
jgi:hypothetical protein